MAVATKAITVGIDDDGGSHKGDQMIAKEHVMDEKDRLGDKLRDKGKAAEDLYFAQQERARLERLKRAAEAPQASAGPGTCPKDGTKLDVQASHGVTIDICPACQGIWLDQGELEIILGQGNTNVTTWLRSLFGR